MKIGIQRGRGHNMDGLWVAVSGFAGVLVGGLFTFLGLREQLKQQLKLDSQQWKHNIVSGPLLKLRE